MKLNSFTPCFTTSDVVSYCDIPDYENETIRNNKLCVTDRSKSILLWWFFLFHVLVFKLFCAVGALCMFSYF